MIKKLLTISAILLSIFAINPCLFAQEVIDQKVEDQDFNQAIDILNFKPDLLDYLVLKELSLYRAKEANDPYEEERFLKSVSMLIVEEIRNNDDQKEFKLKNIDKLFQEQGYALNYMVLSAKVSVRNGPDLHSYHSLAKAIVESWDRNSKYKPVLLDIKRIFAGVSSMLSLDNRRVFVALTTGSYQTFLSNAQFDDLEFEITNKPHGLSPYDESICKKTSRFNLHQLKNKLSVENNDIYFTFDDVKTLRKIIKPNSKDGLAVDIIQQEQYLGNEINKVNFNLPNRGILTKPVFANKLYDSNEIEGKDAKKQIRVYLGQVPLGLDNYELNLVIIKDKCYCNSLQNGFAPKDGFEVYRDIEYLADTITLYDKIDFYPEAVSDEFIARIPFPDSNHKFKYEDLEPFLADFEVPPFIIKNSSIAAFNSCDRSGNREMIALHKQAETIVQALQANQEEKIESDIVTSNGWTLFRDDVIGTKYEPLAFLSQTDATRSFAGYKNDPEFQAILQKHRFAQVQLDVIYDIRGSKEQEYVIYHFNKAIEKENTGRALSIQKYIMKMILSGHYTPEAVIRQRIPFESDFSGLLMNKIWLQFHLDIIDEEGLYSSVNKLYQIDPKNPYIHFNYLNAQISQELIVDEYEIFKVQTSIDKLYQSTLSKETIDALNLDFQFKLITWLDTMETNTNQIDLSLEKIKSIVEQHGNEQNSALQLAYLFINYYDYEYAAKLLEPYILSSEASEELLFTYLAICSYAYEKFYTKPFEKACELAVSVNPDSFCELFSKKKISLIALENPAIKTLLGKYCK